MQLALHPITLKSKAHPVPHYFELHFPSMHCQPQPQFPIRYLPLSVVPRLQRHSHYVPIVYAPVL